MLPWIIYDQSCSTWACSWSNLDVLKLWTHFFSSVAAALGQLIPSILRLHARAMVDFRYTFYLFNNSENKWQKISPKFIIYRPMIEGYVKHGVQDNLHLCHCFTTHVICKNLRNFAVTNPCLGMWCEAGSSSVLTAEPSLANLM